MNYVDRLIVGLLAAILLFSAVDKLFHYQGFLNALMDYVLVPHSLVAALAPTVITAELIVGIGLLVRPWRRQAAFAAAALFMVFAAAIALNYALGGRGICGCWFTITLAESTEIHLLQNLFMGGLAFSLGMGLAAEKEGPTVPALTESP